MSALAVADLVAVPVPAPDDLVAAIVALEHAEERRPWSRATVVEELAGPGRRWFVAVAPADPAGRPAAPVGFAGTARMGDEAHVMRVTVSPSWRRRGLGRRLLAALVTTARDDGAASVTLEVREGNLAARALYASAGLTERGRRPAYYPDGEDALVLTLDLAPAVGAGPEEA